LITSIASSEVEAREVNKPIDSFEVFFKGGVEGHGSTL
jgi:hypothetical protein